MDGQDVPTDGAGAIYLRTRICAPLIRARSAGCIAATKLIWTAMVLNGSEASGPLANGRALKMYS